MQTNQVLIAGLALLTSSGLAAAEMKQGPGLHGASVVLTNTFQGEFSGGNEVDVASFGFHNNRFAKVTDAVEFPNFITLYHVDISADSLAFTWTDSEFANSVSGSTPEGNHDRNYFIFDLPEGEAITSIVFDAEASQMLPDSAEPTATILGPNRVVTDFSGGVVRGLGFNPVFKVTVGPAE